jgi:type II secretion system protein J
MRIDPRSSLRAPSHRGGFLPSPKLRRTRRRNAVILQPAGVAPAFTLIELILAMAIAAMVLVGITGVFFSAMRLRDRTVERVDNALPLEQALTTLRRDLENAVPPSTNGVFLGNFKVGSVNSTDLNQPVDIELYTTTGALRANEPWGEVQRVTYALRLPDDRSAAGKDLVRTVTRNILATVPPPPTEQRLLGGVESVEFGCYDGTQWRDYWDTTLGDTNLPTAIRVRLQLAGGDASSQPIEMVVPIVCQPRTIPALAGGSGT